MSERVYVSKLLEVYSVRSNALEITVFRSTHDTLTCELQVRTCVLQVAGLATSKTGLGCDDTGLGCDDTGLG